MLDENTLNELEKYRDEKFQIKLEDCSLFGMKLVEIKITTNGTNWSAISLKTNEIEKLISTLKEHLK